MESELLRMLIDNSALMVVFIVMVYGIYRTLKFIAPLLKGYLETAGDALKSNSASLSELVDLHRTTNERLSVIEKQLAGLTKTGFEDWTK